MFIFDYQDEQQLLHAHDELESVGRPSSFFRSTFFVSPECFLLELFLMPSAL